MTKDELDAVIATVEAAVAHFPPNIDESGPWEYEDEEDLKCAISMNKDLVRVVKFLREFNARQNALEAVVAAAREVFQFREGTVVLRTLICAIRDLDALEGTL